MKNPDSHGILSLHQYAGTILLIAFISFFIGVSRGGEPDSSFSFVFMTDIHVKPELKGDEGFRAAIARVNMLKPDFVITGGDLIMDALEQNYERAVMLYDMYIEISRKFNMPVYNLIGNHEVFGLYEESGINPDHPEYGKNMFKKRIGNNKTYYSFEEKGWHFIMIDGIGFTPDREYFGKVDSVQMEWIRKDIEKIEKETPVIICTHIPFVSVSEQVFSGGTSALLPYLAVENSNDVLSLFDGYNLKLILQGHLHIVEDLMFRDVHFITGGAVSGAWWGGPYEGFPEGFIIVNVKDGDFTWRYETFGWEAVKTDQ